MMMMKKQEKALNGNNYVLVLIDGDGMIVGIAYSL